MWWCWAHVPLLPQDLWEGLYGLGCPRHGEGAGGARDAIPQGARETDEGEGEADETEKGEEREEKGH